MGRRHTLSITALAAALVGGAAGCAPPAPPSTGGATTVLYVTNSRDGTVSRIDGASGRVLGEPRPAGVGPRRAVAGPGGRLLVMSVRLGPDGSLTHVAPAGGRWAARPLPLERDPGRYVAEAFLTADGGQHAAVAYGLWPRKRDAEAEGAGGPEGPSRCRLALVDLRKGEVTASHRLCSPQEVVVGLALDDDPPGPIAYLGLGQLLVPVGVPGAAEAPAGGPPAANDRVLALDATTGAVMAALPLDGVVGRVTLGPAPHRLGQRLYVVETLSRRSEDDGDASPAPYRGRLLGLDPTTLAVESENPIPEAPEWLAVAPEGDAAYFLGGGLWQEVIRLDFLSGAATRLTKLPGKGSAGGLAVTEERVYVSDISGHELWAFDRRRGRLVQTIPVGQGPQEITAGPAV
jgi:DNA-binding beta-propeller fold protein YncE